MVFLPENFFCQLLSDSTGASLFPKSFNSTAQGYRIKLKAKEGTFKVLRFDIDLRPANVYFLRMTYQGATPARVYDDIGTWSLASDLRTLALKGARQSPMLFSITNANTLRKLDSEGQTIESELNYGLTRADFDGLTIHFG